MISYFLWQWRVNYFKYGSTSGNFDVTWELIRKENLGHSPEPLKYNLHINKVSMWFIHTVTFESTVLKYKITVSNFLFSENDSKLPLDYMTPLCKLEKGIPSAHSVWKNDNVTVQKKKKKRQLFLGATILSHGWAQTGQYLLGTSVKYMVILAILCQSHILWTEVVSSYWHHPWHW